MSREPGSGAVLIILDGMGDRPCQKLGGATPLEYAATPVMDQLAAQGLCGLAAPFPPGFPVDTHTGTAPLFGLPEHSARKLARGPVEAAGVGLEVAPENIVFRANFATFSEQYQLLDRRAGRIDRGVDILAQAINRIPPVDGVELTFRPATGHRGVVRLRGEGLSIEVTNTDPGRSTPDRPARCFALSAEVSAIRTAEIINRWSRSVFEVLNSHPLNRQRSSEGLPPANGIILRGGGQHNAQHSLLKALGIDPLVVAAEATILGLAALCGFETVHRPSFTALSNTDIPAKVEAARQALSRYPLVILHFKAPDICAHDLDPVAKADFLQAVDQALPPLLAEARGVVVTADHSTSSESGHHCGDPVPSLLYYPGGRRDHCNTFSEVSCMQGGMGTIASSSLLLMLLDGMGWMHNYRVKDQWMLQ